MTKAACYLFSVSAMLSAFSCVKQKKAERILVNKTETDKKPAARNLPSDDNYQRLAEDIKYAFHLYKNHPDKESGEDSHFYLSEKVEQTDTEDLQKIMESNSLTSTRDKMMMAGSGAVSLIGLVLSVSGINAYRKYTSISKDLEIITSLGDADKKWPILQKYAGSDFERFLDIRRNAMSTVNLKYDLLPSHKNFEKLLHQEILNSLDQEIIRNPDDEAIRRLNRNYNGLMNGEKIRQNIKTPVAIATAVGSVLFVAGMIGAAHFSAVDRDSLKLTTATPFEQLIRKISGFNTRLKALKDQSQN